MTVFGIDVSEHQNGMSLQKAAAEGIDFFIIRTNDGLHRDHVYRSHVDDARATGKPISAYMFLRPGNVEAQVRTSLEIMGTDHRYPIWLDVEAPEGGITVDHIRQARDLFHAAGVPVLGAYSYVPYWEGRIVGGEPDTHEFGRFWVAAYPAGSYSDVPARIYERVGGDHAWNWGHPLGNQLPSLWQFTSSGAVAGRRVDVNAYRGSLDELSRLFMATNIQTIPEEEDSMFLDDRSIVSNIDSNVVMTGREVLQNIDGYTWQLAVKQIPELVAKIDALTAEVQALKEGK